MIEYLFHLNHVTPDDYVKDVSHIDLLKLKSLGIQTIFIDLDNTLISYQETEPNPWMKEWFQSIQSLGFQLIIVSNNHGPRVRHFASLVDLDCIASAKKPLQVGFRKAEKRLGIHDASKVCLIGDQIMTDVLGGKRRGYYVILVDAIDRSSEKWFTRMNRMIEKRVLRRLSKGRSSIYQALHLHEKR